jgi:hypothetical protein
VGAQAGREGEGLVVAVVHLQEGGREEVNLRSISITDLWPVGWDGQLLEEEAQGH